MLEILSARFLYDPQFSVYINNQKLELSEHKNATKEIIKVNEKIQLLVTVVDSSKSARNAMQHGIAFWAEGRFVGEPSWSYGKYVFADGRRKIAKRYTIVVEIDDLYDEIFPDWTGFRDSYVMNDVYSSISRFVSNLFQKVYAEEIEERQMEVLKNNIEELELLSGSRIAQHEISNFIMEITQKKPDISPDVLNIAVSAMLNVEKSRSGVELLSKLSRMSSADITTLNAMLNDWSVNDILAVISEIDN